MGLSRHPPPWALLKKTPIFPMLARFLHTVYLGTVFALNVRPFKHCLDILTLFRYLNIFYAIIMPILYFTDYIYFFLEMLGLSNIFSLSNIIC